LPREGLTRIGLGLAQSSVPDTENAQHFHPHFTASNERWSHGDDGIRSLWQKAAKAVEAVEAAKAVKARSQKFASIQDTSKCN
jgi:hypothetical protein